MIKMQIPEASPMTRPAELLYTAKVHTTGGREAGSSVSSDGRLDIRFSLPYGPDDGPNPEQLFAAAWSACLLSEVKRVAAEMEVELPVSAVIDAEIDLWKGDDGPLLRARLNVDVPHVDRDIAQTILEGAHQSCSYSKATRGNIHTEIKLVEK
jgi:osmotically inducible protein OsmC